MKHVFYIFLLTLVSSSYSQIIIRDSSNLKVKGSFFIIAQGSDGIMVAADSRSVIFNNFDSSHTPLAYFDSTQKAFIVGKNVIVFTGSGLYGNWLTNGIIDVYKR